MPIPNYVTNANPPKLDSAYPIAGGGDADGCGNLGIRKTGTSKIKIPKGPLIGFVAHWLNPNGVMRVLLDHVIKNEDLTKRLGHDGETNTKDRQVVVDGYSKISQRTKEADLDALAISLLTRGFPEAATALSGNGDAILTYFGFRKASDNDAARRAGFVERLVALQLIIRRGMEVRTDMNVAGTADDKFPLYLISVGDYNSCDWDATLATAEAPGTATKQTLDPAQQDAAALQRNGPAIVVGSLTEEAGPANATMAATMATIERLTEEAARKDKESTRKDEEIQTMKRRRIHGPQGADPAFPIERAQPAPFLPTHSIPHSADTNTTPQLDDIGATAILNQPEIDPADSVDLEVVPEVVAKYKAFATITAEFVHCDAKHASLEEECRAGTGRSGCSQHREQPRRAEKKRTELARNRVVRTTS